ncbi:hypothetical protein KSF_096040 [Reticulibacter mediterranei]|uniref:Uncharacterized protein n=1 Tax=Reticulibacter mediterranei TaxID=2778369 RepID=A0A8J3J0W4_9CHLR|nr:hypothetical protein [Reticulibacter mediterranei]GHO99556.1 hypothetical protein KSF_096040 [Reticulibacter mediterranei]
MADFGTITTDYNKGTDASPDWTGTTIALSGTSGANEFRMALSTGSQTTTTPSASWPYMPLPASGASAVDRLYAFSTNTSGIQVATYDGTNAKARVLRKNFSNNGNPISAMQFSFFADSTHANPSGGTQPPGSHNDTFTNGTSGETSSKSAIKCSMYGSGATAGGTQETPSAGTVGTSPGATTGTSGAVTTTAGNWLNANGAWQDLAGWNDYIIGVAIPAASTAFFWYYTLIIYLVASMTTQAGGWQIVDTVQYSYA